MNIFCSSDQHPQQSGLEAILDFDIFTEDSDVLSSLLGFITFYDIYLDEDIANVWEIQAYVWKFLILN